VGQSTASRGLVTPSPSSRPCGGVYTPSDHRPHMREWTLLESHGRGEDKLNYLLAYIPQPYACLCLHRRLHSSPDVRPAFFWERLRECRKRDTMLAAPVQSHAPAEICISIPRSFRPRTPPPAPSTAPAALHEASCSWRSPGPRSDQDSLKSHPRSVFFLVRFTRW